MLKIMQDFLEHVLIGLKSRIESAAVIAESLKRSPLTSSLHNKYRNIVSSCLLFEKKDVPTLRQVVTWMKKEQTREDPALMDSITHASQFMVHMSSFHRNVTQLNDARKVIIGYPPDYRLHAMQGNVRMFLEASQEFHHALDQMTQAVYDFDQYVKGEETVAIHHYLE